ncbi:MAG TPA: antibiotic biosynthesis monooxygenase [Mycobacteriales bacterium]|nr:antibiotic biosynthesis monooxygenase [Mycobacteriales bacterium]
MITRMWEAGVRPEVHDEFVRWLTDQVWPLMAEADGFAGGELYTAYDGASRLVFITHWRDETSLEAFAGADWLREPVVGADPAGDFLDGTPRVWHFRPLPTPPAEDTGSI